MFGYYGVPVKRIETRVIWFARKGRCLIPFVAGNCHVIGNKQYAPFGSRWTFY